MRKHIFFLGLEVVLSVIIVVGYLNPAKSFALLPATITITNPSGPQAMAEDAEYATLQWGDPWDMSDSLDVRQLDSPQCVFPNHFDEYAPCDVGIWCGKVRSDISNPDLFLLHPGYQNGLHVGRTGQLKPIDANQYTQITFRMYIDSVDVSDPGLQLYWTNGTVADIGGSPSKYGGSHLYQTYAGWNIYTIDLSQETTPLNGSLPWSGNMTGLRLDPGLNNMNNRLVFIDWVRLTPRPTHHIAWTANVSGDVQIRLQNNGNDDDLLVYEGGQYPVFAYSSDSAYDIPASLPAGDWYIQLGINSETSTPAGPWKIQETPVLNFIEPSTASGDNYAQVELGNPWDMNSADDIFNYDGISSLGFSNGELSGISQDKYSNNSCAAQWEDPHINLLNDHIWEGNADPAIDTSKYRYLNFRLKLDGVPDISYGWIARVNWSNADAGGGFRNCGITNDIPLHVGWNEVSLDLWDSNIMDEVDACQSVWQAFGTRNQVRFDPLEVPVETTFYIDEISLTAENTVQQDSVFKIEYGGTDVLKTATITFFYDVDTNLGNGRTVASEYSPGSNPPPTGPYFVYLPLLLNNYNYTSFSGESFAWDLTGIPAGTYYVSADVNDGYKTTTWYSEVPVIIQP